MAFPFSYWWYRGFLKRAFAFLGLAVIIFNVFLYYDYQIHFAFIVAFVGMAFGFVLSYPIDIIFFYIKNIWISKRHRNLLSKKYMTCFSEQDCRTNYEDGSNTIPYNHFEKVFFYKRHIILKPVGMGNFFQILKWQDVPEHQREELQNLLTEKILKAPKL